MDYTFKDHKLVDVRYEHSPNGRRRIKPSGLIIHFTAIDKTEGVVRHFKRRSSKVSAHIVLGEDGELIQMKPFNTECWHVGRSKLGQKTRLNRHTIGIEIVNYGPTKNRKQNGRVVSRAGRDTKEWDYFDPEGPNGDPDRWIKAYHPLEKGRYQHWQKYSDKQFTVLDDLIPALVTEYSLTFIKGHEDVALPRGRKTDPGPAFPLSYYERFAEKRFIEPVSLEDAEREIAKLGDT